MVQWLRLHASIAGGVSSVPGWGTKILHAMQCGQKKTKNKKQKNSGSNVEDGLMWERKKIRKSLCESILSGKMYYA